MNKIITNSSIIKYKDINSDDINLLIEIIKGKQYCKLLNNFIYSCLNTLPKHIFSNKKSVHRTLTNLYSSWFFSLYSEYDFNDDPFFPSNFKKSDVLKNTLLNYCSVDKNIKDRDEKIDNIINKNLLLYENILKHIKQYKNNVFFKTNRTNYNIKKSVITKNRNNNKIIFIKFNLCFNFNFYLNNIRIKNILNNLLIPLETYNKMKNKYIGDKKYIDEYFFVILFRYQLLGSNNHQLSILPKIFNKLNEDFNFEIECFASSINSSSNIYCSIYSDVEKYFGSIGSFFQIDIIKGFFILNPPYQEDIIEKSIEKVLYFMKKTSEKLAFFITIPIWDLKGKKYMKDNLTENNNNFIEYGDFDIMDKIRNSTYFYGLKMISKNDFSYLDHNYLLYKNKTIQNTYVIILANFKNKMIDKINNYNFYE